MRSLRRRALAMGACAAMMLAALVTGASSASASSSWQLVDEYSTSHPVCYTTSGGTSNLAIDLNGVPPAGIEGVELNDKAVNRQDCICYGALGVGGTKMKIHKAAVAALFTKNDQVFDIDQIYQFGKTLGL